METFKNYTEATADNIVEFYSKNDPVRDDTYFCIIEK